MRGAFLVILSFNALLLLSSAFLQSARCVKVPHVNTNPLSRSGVVLGNSNNNVASRLPHTPFITTVGTRTYGSMTTSAESSLPLALLNPARIPKALSIVSAGAAAMYLYQTSNKAVRLWLFALRLSFQMVSSKFFSQSIF